MARQTLSASTVAATSCTRTMAAPRATAASAAATLPAVRSSTGLPVMRPTVDLRDQPTSSGRPSDSSSYWRAASCRLCSGVLPKPTPGSSAMRSAPMPAAVAAERRSARKRRTSTTTSSYAGAACMVPGSPSMCMRHTPAVRCAAAACNAPGRCSARTSFTMSAPASSTAAITSGRLVSTDTGTPSVTACWTTGSTRRSSSARSGVAEPGRVDSPPMSRMSTPSATRVSQWRRAASVSAWRPPSENESGVTLTMPITCGRERSMRKREVCQKAFIGFGSNGSRMQNGAARPRLVERSVGAAFRPRPVRRRR